MIIWKRIQVGFWIGSSSFLFFREKRIYGIKQCILLKTTSTSDDCTNFVYLHLIFYLAYRILKKTNKRIKQIHKN